MLSALFIPRTADEETVDAVIKTGTRYGMVLCVPKNFSPDREFSCIFFPPDRIPSGFREARIAVKSPTRATVSPSPCAA